MFGEIIKDASLESGLSVDIIAAVIYEESRGEPWAFRYEPAFFAKYIDKKTKSSLGGYWPESPPSLATELRGRATSFGLMQVMGQTAREHGFAGRYLTMLCDPVVNIKLGTRILADKIRKAGSLEAGLLRWNGGADKQYPERVKQWLKTAQYSFLLLPASASNQRTPM